MATVFFGGGRDVFGEGGLGPVDVVVMGVGGVLPVAEFHVSV